MGGFCICRSSFFVYLTNFLFRDNGKTSRHILKNSPGCGYPRIYTVSDEPTGAQKVLSPYFVNNNTVLDNMQMVLTDILSC